jgi:hypothetical protein
MMMMKYLILLVMLVGSLTAQAKQKNYDILVYSKTETQWNLFLLQEFRTFMNNFSLGIDPLHVVNDNAPLVYDEASINDFVSENARILIQKIENASGIDILNVKPELIVDGVGYKLEELIPRAKAVENRKGDVTFKTDMTMKGVDVFANELNLTFVLPKLVNGRKIPALEVKIIRPRVTIDYDFDINFKVDVTVEEHKKHVQLKFANGNFDHIINSIKDQPEFFNITYDDLIVPHVNLNLMGRDFAVNSDKVKEIIETHKPSLQAIMLEQLGALFEKNGAMDVLENFHDEKFSKEHWINTTEPTSLPMYLGIDDISVVDDGIVKMSINGEFCTFENYVIYKEKCGKNRKTKTPKSTITQANIRYSDQFARDMLKQDDVKFIATLSDDYINKIMSTTIDAGYWDDIKKELEIEIGDRGAFAKLNEQGDTASVYLDVIYDVGGLGGFLLNIRKIRFPITLKVKARVENMMAEMEDPVTGEITRGDFPHVVFNIFDVDLDENNFRYGIDEYDLPSNVMQVRKILRGTVIKKIKKALFDYDAPEDRLKYRKWKGTDLPGLLFPELSDMQLDKMKVKSDGHGRLMLILNGSDVVYKGKSARH